MGLLQTDTVSTALVNGACRNEEAAARGCNAGMYLGLQQSLSRCLASGKLRKVGANHNTPAGTKIRLQETWMLECIYLPHRGVYGLKGNDCEILKTKSPMQMLNSLLVVMFRTTPVRIFQRNGTGPNSEKESSEAQQQCFICFDS